MAANGALRAAVRDSLAELSSLANAVSSADELVAELAERIKDRWKRDVWVDTGRLRASVRVEKL